MSRDLLFEYINREKLSLEIGPRDRPFLKKGEYNVFYADIRDEDGVVELYSGIIDGIKPVHIDHVINGTYKDALSGIGEFATVFSSHVIEHTIDIIGHLREIAEILEEGGRYVLCVPDKRVTFDYFHEITPFRDAYDVYLHGGQSLRRLAFDYFFNVNKSFSPWISDLYKGRTSYLGVATDPLVTEKALHEAQHYEDNIGGAHYWAFTFPSFLGLLRDCLRLNLLPFMLEHAAGTEIGSNEFHIVLRKNTCILEDNELRTDEIKKIVDLMEHPPGRKQLDDFLGRCQQVYFYGSAISASYYLRHMPVSGIKKVAGLVVSDGYEKESFDFPVFWLSEIQPDETTGFIIMMGDSAKQEVMPGLRANTKSRILETPLLD